MISTGRGIIMSAVSAVPQIHCPSCGAGDVRESHTRSPVDAVLSMFGLVAYRCRACRNRFHKKPPHEDSEEELDEPKAEARDEHSDTGSR